jgi:hypothetical protein
MNKCNFCNDKFNDIELEHHCKICLYYVYNTKYAVFKNNTLNNDELELICKILNLFNLHMYSINSKFNIDILIKKLILKYSITQNSYIPIIINELKSYSYSSINYNELLLLIEYVIRYSKNNILDVLNAYKICYNNLMLE